MTSATTGSASGMRGYRGEGHGLILFGSVLLVIIGCFNLIYGIAPIAHWHVFVANAHYVFASLRTWGWVTLIIGVLQLLAAAGVVAGSKLARWFAVAVLVPIAIDQVFFIRAYPFWSLVISAVDWSRCTGCVPTAAARTSPPDAPGMCVGRARAKGCRA